MNHTTSSRLPLWKSHLPNSLQKLMFVAVHCAALELSKSLINLDLIDLLISFPTSV